MGDDLCVYFVSGKSRNSSKAITKEHLIRKVDEGCSIVWNSLKPHPQTNSIFQLPAPTYLLVYMKDGL